MPIESCPLCYRMYARLGQHLTVMHNVKNKLEKKYLLALESGRVNVRQGRCPVPGCGKETTRLDRHIQAHTELSEADRANTITACKQRKLLDLLSALRASNPEVPMVSTLDLERGERELEDPTTAAVLEPEEEEEEEEDRREKVCESEPCKRLVKRQSRMIADLNQQVDDLTETLRSVTRRYRALRRKSEARGSARIKQVARRLLSSLGPEEEEEATEEEVPRRPRAGAHLVSPPPPPPSPTSSEEGAPSASQPGPSTGKPASPPHYPDHVVVLSEYSTVVTKKKKQCHVFLCENAFC